jgi:hypothetical protein
VFVNSERFVHFFKAFKPFLIYWSCILRMPFIFYNYINPTYIYLPFPLGVWTAAEFDSLCSSCSPWTDLLTLAPSYPDFVLPSSGTRPILAFADRHYWQGRKLCWGRVAGNWLCQRLAGWDKRSSLCQDLRDFKLAAYFKSKVHLAFLLAGSICIGKYQAIKR